MILFTKRKRRDMKII